MASVAVRATVLALGMGSGGSVEDSQASDAATRHDSTRSSTGGADAGNDTGTDMGKEADTDTCKDVARRLRLRPRARRRCHHELALDGRGLSS
jgi:hypothetical protein